MKSRALVPPARSLLSGSSRTTANRSFLPPSQIRLLDSSSIRNDPKLHTHPARYLSSASGASALSIEERISSKLTDAAPEEPEDEGDKALEPDKVRRTRRPTRIIEGEQASTPLPPGLDILWTPEELTASSSEAASSSSSDAAPASPPHIPLPPPELFADILNNLLITLHPHTQHRATYSSSNGSPVEPTLALYCPIEGGDYILDETVRELARRTGSEVVVLDAVQLAGGEWGEFGKAAAAVQLPQNPLHFHAPPSRSNRSQGRETEEWDTDDDEYYTGPSQMTLHVMAHGIPVRAGKSPVLTPTRGSSASKIKSFFDDLINISSPGVEETGKRRPRLVYIRDYPTLAPSASVWYAPLLSSVRQRRQGPISRPSSPISNPMAIIFGMTPPIVPPSSNPSDMGPQSMLGLTTTRQSTSTLMSNSSTRSGKGGNVYSEDEHADKARERRLRDRLRKWEREDPSFWDDTPRIPSGNGSSEGGQEGRPGMVVVGPGMAGFPPSLPQALVSSLQGQLRASGQGDAETQGSSHFFRSSVVVPATRSLALERTCRMARRREINELTMRMGVGAVGGILEKLSPIPPSHTLLFTQDQPTNVEDPEVNDFAKMWSDWGKHVEVWSAVKSIADRAVGSVVANTSAILSILSPSKNTLEPTEITWDSVVRAWAAHRASRNVKKAWLNETTGKTAKERALEDDEMDRGQKADGKEDVDEVVQQVKNDPDLTQHESRLLGCIVDAATMPTSFSQVHLPPHTIDSVRTIVSLPILHPSAFQQGILREHSMTGCLLFGPPGTGKTLVVRALAKEAGCRMLSIAPSDVMDMYVGEGEKLVRSVFSLARRLSPCVVFLDEIDALFGARMSTRETGGAIAHRGVITEFMQEMDGLKTTKDTNVVVIGATNRPFDLDDAVLRRLPRRLLVDLPGEKEREGILKILLRDEQLGEDVDIHSLAKRTELFSGSDLKHLCVSAALDAVKEGVALPWNVPPRPESSAEMSTSPTDAPVSNIDSAETGEVQSSQSDGEKQAETNSSSSASAEDSTDGTSSSGVVSRTLHLRHFNKALREITPSSSESLGSLSALRKWNEEFGENSTKKRKIMWGKGLFGFSEPGEEHIPDGKVSLQDRTDGVEGVRK